MIGHADRAAPLRDYCAGLLAAEGRKSVEPMAAVTAPARVSVQHQKLLHFVGEGNVVGRAGAGQGARAGDAGDRASRTDRGLDHRRYVLPQAGHPFGRRASSVLRAARQAGQLSGGGDVVDRQSSCQPADRLSAVSAEGLGRRCGSAARKRMFPRRSDSRPSRRSRWRRSARRWRRASRAVSC